MSEGVFLIRKREKKRRFHVFVQLFERDFSVNRDGYLFEMIYETDIE